MDLDSNKLNSFKEEFQKLRAVFQANNSLTKFKQFIFFFHIRNLGALDSTLEKWFLLFWPSHSEKEESDYYKFFVQFFLQLLDQNWGGGVVLYMGVNS